MEREGIRGIQDSVTNSRKLLPWKKLRERNRDFGLSTRREKRVKDTKQFLQIE
jgi:hypothetical protein